jgi:hypothetical protein
MCFYTILRSSMASRSVRFGVRSWKLSNVCQSLDGWPKIYFLESLRASEGKLSRWSRLHLQSLAPTNPHWARVVGYSPFSLCIIHKEGLCPSSGDINRVMMMILYYASYIIILPLETLYLFKKNRTLIRWVVLKIYTYIGRNSGKRLCFVRCYVWLCNYD